MRGYLSGGKHPYPGVSTHLHSRVYRGQTILGHNMYGTNTAVLWLLCGQRLAGPKQRVPILRDSLMQLLQVQTYGYSGIQLKKLGLGPRKDLYIYALQPN